MTLKVTCKAFLLIFDTRCLHKLLYNFLFEVISEIESPKSSYNHQKIIFIIFRIEFGTFDPNLVVEAVIGVTDRSSRSNEVKEGENYFVCLFLYIEKTRIVDIV